MYLVVSIILNQSFDWVFISRERQDQSYLPDIKLWPQATTHRQTERGFLSRTDREASLWSALVTICFETKDQICQSCAPIKNKYYYLIARILERCHLTVDIIMVKWIGESSQVCVCVCVYPFSYGGNPFCWSHSYILSNSSNANLKSLKHKVF